MSEPVGYSRIIQAHINDMKRSLGALLGITQGLLCDQHLNDQEIRFLNDRLTANDEIAATWPGNVLQQRIRAAMADGVITEAERVHLVDTLQELIGGNTETLAAATHVTECAFDDVAVLEYPGFRFCLTGDFVYGLRDLCAAEIEKRGGIVGNSSLKR